MPTAKHNWILLAFAIAATANIFAEIIKSQQLVFISKPLLMLSLAAYFWLNTPKSKFRNWMVTGIIFALFGDTFLMLNGRHGAESSPLFLYGLASFLLTHVCYSIAFIGYHSSKRGLLQWKPVLLLPFLLYFVLFWSWIYEFIPTELMMPVTIYSSVIVFMAMAAVNLSNKIPRITTYLILVGVFLFIFSDTCIAINKFTAIQLPQAGVLIMLTYILGQFAIVIGATKIAQDVSL